MERRERGFFGKVLVFILSILAVIGLIAMILSVISPYINPKHFIWASFFGLSFWVILAYNVVILLFLMLFWSRKAWIAVLALLVAIPGLNKSYSFGSKATGDNGIRIMSYNVHMFRPVGIEEVDKEQFAYQVMNMVKEQSPDILCCQEFFDYSNKISRIKCIEEFAKTTGFQYVYFNRKDNYAGNVIFSKYPIAKVDENSGFGKENTYGVMVSVDAGEKGKFHVANMHLLSYNITDNELDVLTSTPDRQNNLDTISRSVLHKLGSSFQRRSDELQSVLDEMPPVDGPIIICGDFNETPLSYNYRQMQKAGFTDTFTKVGRGIKPTYAGKLPLLRIDYVWANNGVTPFDFNRLRYKGSDHYPVMLDFSIQ